MKGYGWAIHVMRASRGLTQTEVADDAGVTSGAMSLIESGKRSPSVRTLARIAKAMDTTMVQLAYLAELDELLEESNILRLSPGECRGIVLELLR